MKKSWLVIFILTIILALITGLLLLRMVSSPAYEETPSSRTKEKKEEEANGISAQEKQQIEAWIKENDLNQYGDPKDTVYLGGTPLFDEETSAQIDRYEYILRNHPDRSWLK